MKNKRLSSVWSERQLPADLWLEILSRLPVKSLVQFRCVSKSCLTLIADLDFSQLHLRNLKSNRHETHLLVVEGKGSHSYVRHSDTFKREGARLFTLGPDWLVVCSIDGMLLLRSRFKNVAGFNELKVWNPSIRMFHEFPSLPEFETSPNSSLMDAEIGLGYDPLVKDYKHVKLVFGNGRNLQAVAVYTLRAGSWKIIPFQGRGCSKWHWNCDFRIFNIKTVYLRGSLYFIAKDPNSRVSDLVSIDLSSEVFSSASLPHCSGFTELALVDDGCSLTFAAGDSKSWRSSVWVLESESRCWNKRYTFDLKFDGFLYWKNGDILIRRLGAETELNTWWDRVASYSPKTGEEKILLQHKNRALYMHNVCGYVESLIMLQK